MWFIFVLGNGDAAEFSVNVCGINVDEAERGYKFIRLNGSHVSLRYIYIFTGNYK